VSVSFQQVQTQARRSAARPRPARVAAAPPGPNRRLGTNAPSRAQAHEQIKATGRELVARGLPATLRWDANAEDGGEAFQVGAADLLNQAWRYLEQIGATKLGRWDAFLPSERDSH
jgi:hypothetical protein